MILLKRYITFIKKITFKNSEKRKKLNKWHTSVLNIISDMCLMDILNENAAAKIYQVICLQVTCCENAFKVNDFTKTIQNLVEKEKINLVIFQLRIQ